MGAKAQITIFDQNKDILSNLSESLLDSKMFQFNILKNQETPAQDPSSEKIHIFKIQNNHFLGENLNTSS